MWAFFWISVIFFCGGFVLTNTATLRCYKGSLDNYEVTDLNNPQAFIESKCIDITLETVFYVMGFKTTPNSDTTKHILQAYITLGYVTNLILLDWSKESYSTNLTIVDDAAWYSLVAVPASVVIGEQMGHALIKLSERGMDLRKTDLVGMSLGCHLLAESAKVVLSEGKKLYSIKCLDAANPGYGKPTAVMQPLNKDCADHVFCIHTDPGFFGLNESLCTSDVYINYRHFIDGDYVQPGCPDRITYRGCSHIYCAYVYVDAMLRPTTLIASGAPDYWTWAADNGSGTNIVDIGVHNSIMASHGNYYMTTNPSQPYGKGEDGLRE